MNEDLRRLAQKAGALPPYRKPGTILMAVRRMPEWICASEVLGGPFWRTMSPLQVCDTRTWITEFRSVQTWLGWTWMAHLISDPHDPPLLKSWIMPVKPTGPRGNLEQEIKMDFSKFVVRLRCLAVVKLSWDTSLVMSEGPPAWPGRKRAE